MTRHMPSPCGLVEAINTAPFTELIQVVIRKLIHNAEPFIEHGEEAERGATRYHGSLTSVSK